MDLISKIPRALLIDYLQTILNMSVARNNPDYYIYFHNRRTELHDEILKIVNKTREDKDFANCLAEYIEETIFNGGNQ